MPNVNPERAKKMLEAVKAGDLAKVRLYLKAGVPAEYDPRFLQIAASHGHENVFNVLIDAGANINVRDEVQESLLQCAVICGCLPIIDIVLNKATLSQTDLDESLCSAANYARPKVVERLLLAGSDPQYVDYKDGTALIAAVCNDQEENALLLLNAGADPTMRLVTATANTKEFYKKSVTQIATLKGMTKLLPKLLKWSAKAMQTQKNTRPTRKRIFKLDSIRDDPRFGGLTLGGSLENKIPSILGRETLQDDLYPIHELESGLPIERLAGRWGRPRALGKVKPFNDHPMIDYCPCFSKRACEALGDLLAGNGELLPVDTISGEYFIFHVTKVIDLLDLEKSDIKFRHEHPKIALEVERFVIRQGIEIDAPIFKIPQLVREAFVTDEFYNRVLEAKLNGFCFYRAYPTKVGEHWRRPYNPDETENLKAKVAALYANTIVLLFETETASISVAEEKRMDKIIEQLDKILDVDTLDDSKYLGNVEMYDVVDGKVRLYISCPDSKKLAGILQRWLANLKWWPNRPEMIAGDFDYREAPNEIIPKLFHDE
jgi:hypothetical protein